MHCDKDLQRRMDINITMNWTQFWDRYRMEVLARTKQLRNRKVKSIEWTWDDYDDIQSRTGWNPTESTFVREIQKQRDKLIADFGLNVS